MKNQSFLHGRTCYLTPLSQTDLSAEYVSWLNDPEVCKYNSHGVYPETQETVAQYIASVQGSRTSLVFAIRTLRGNIHIGNASIQSLNYINRTGEIAILIGNTSWWGKGIATEVYELLINYGFQTLNLHRIWSGMTEDNEGMQKVAQKVGMSLEGTFREAFFKNGVYRNLVYYAILKHEHTKRVRKK